MQILMNIALIIIGVLLFEFIIFAHEFGHFITAKKSGVQVNEFALGMGPKLISFQRGETRYSLRLFPIGGFCAMEGEDQDSDNPRAFNNAKVWKRMIIIVAGAFMNIVVGFILMFVVTVCQPTFSTTQISQFEPVSFSAKSGLEIGDDIKSVGGYSVANIRDLMLGIQLLPCEEVDPDSIEVYREDCAWEARNFISEMAQTYRLSDEIVSKLYYGDLADSAQKLNKAATKEEAAAVYQQTIDRFFKTAGVEKPANFQYPAFDVPEKRVRYQGDVTVVRGGETKDIHNVQFYTFKKQDGSTAVSVDFYVLPKDKNFGTVMGETFTGTVSLAKSVWKSFAMLIQGRFSLNDMSGPVGITKTVSDVAAKGLESGFGDAVLNIVMIMALITVNLGIVNMFPFPALDGGRFVFLCIEAIIRRPLPRKMEYIVNGIGLALLILLIILISANDIFKLFTGGFQTLD